MPTPLRSLRSDKVVPPGRLQLLRRSKPMPTSMLFAPPRETFKRADRGLFGKQTIRFGENIPDNKFGGQHTKRTWKPNVLCKYLYSKALNQKIKLKITAKTLKTIDKHGGLDNYLLRDKASHRKQLGMRGTELRHLILFKDKIAEETAELEAQRAAEEPTAEFLKLSKKEKRKALRRKDRENTLELKQWRDAAIKLARKGITRLSQLPPKIPLPKRTI